MKSILKTSLAAALGGVLILAAVTPGSARWNRGGAAAAGFATGALVGAAVATGANGYYGGPNYYSGRGYNDAYAYEPGYAAQPYYGPGYGRTLQEWNHAPQTGGCTDNCAN